MDSSVPKHIGRGSSSRRRQGKSRKSLHRECDAVSKYKTFRRPELFRAQPARVLTPVSGEECCYLSAVVIADDVGRILARRTGSQPVPGDLGPEGPHRTEIGKLVGSGRHLRKLHDRQSELAGIPLETNVVRTDVDAERLEHLIPSCRAHRRREVWIFEYRSNLHGIEGQCSGDRDSGAGEDLVDLVDDRFAFISESRGIRRLEHAGRHDPLRTRQDRHGDERRSRCSLRPCVNPHLELIVEPTKGGPEHRIEARESFLLAPITDEAPGSADSAQDFTVVTTSQLPLELIEALAERLFLLKGELLHPADQDIGKVVEAYVRGDCCSHCRDDVDPIDLQNAASLQELEIAHVIRKRRKNILDCRAGCCHVWFGRSRHERLDNLLRRDDVASGDVPNLLFTEHGHLLFRGDSLLGELADLLLREAQLGEPGLQFLVHLNLLVID